MWTAPAATRGCVFGAEDTACTTGVGTCVETDVDSCFGNLLVLACFSGMVAGYDCVDFGGSCSGSLCIGLPAEAACATGLMECAGGLSCIGETEESFGSCG